MDTNENQNRIKKILNCAKIFFGVATVVMLLFLFIGEFVFPDERDPAHSNNKVFETEWYHVLENGEKQLVEVPGKVPAEYGEVVTISTTLPDEIERNTMICFNPIWQDAEIYINGQLRQSYSTKDSRPFGTNSILRYVFVELNEEDAGGELTYQFSSNSKYAGTIRTIYIGDEVSVWTYLLEKSGMRTVIAIFIFLMSLSCIIVCFILKMLYKKSLSLHYLAWTIFLCALWMLSESDVKQLVIKNVSVLSSCTYWCLMLIPLPLMLYINDIQQGYYKKVYIGPIVYSTVMLVIGTILQVFDIVQFVQQVPLIHVGIIASIICIIGTITLDTFKKRIADYLAVGIGVYGMLLTAVLEMVLYYYGSPLSLGTVLGIGLLFLLITAIIKTGQELVHSEKKKQQAILARQEQAKFLANMSHEIRTPINAVIGMNEMILRESENETIQEYARNIQSASKMLLGLVNDILDFTKIESGRLELVEDTYKFSRLIQDEIFLLNARVTNKPLSTQIDLEPKIPSKLLGDELRIKQILTNLLSNAVKYTKEGSVTLKVYFEWIDSETVMLHFAVIDTGVGIKEEDLSQLFASFKRLELNKNRNVEGTGLGLNIVKKLVDSMQGTISVESEYGKGSTFTVSIPQKVIDWRPFGGLEAVLQESRKKKTAQTDYFTAPDASILVVDDNSMNLSLMRSLLKRSKAQVDVAISGKECLELTKQKLYNDHMMPELDGVETLHMLRTDTSNPNRNTIVIALTANAIAGCREMYLEYGFDEYLSKPIQTEQFDEMLAKFLAKPAAKGGEELQVEKNAVSQNPVAEQKDSKQKEPDTDLLQIDREKGLSYCLSSEELYQEILNAFYEQAVEYLPQLDTYFKEANWTKYEIVVHALKGNALNIGATNFSKLSLQHEMACKQENIEFIRAEYAEYIKVLKRLMEKVQNLLQ